MRRTRDVQEHDIRENVFRYVNIIAGEKIKKNIHKAAARRALPYRGGGASVTSVIRTCNKL